MSRNDAEDYAQRLYARVPAQYRVYDADQGLPLLALFRLVGTQAAALRRDLDDLWDNFFIETCDDWVVPYLAALVGTQMLPHPVVTSQRLDVRNTVAWRRTKGTPAMLLDAAGAITGWPTDLAEFFRSLGWSQNVNHVRPDRTLTPDLRDRARLDRLGHADDPFAHAASVSTGGALDQPRLVLGPPHAPGAAWGTPGRYQITNLGVFVRRLSTFTVRGATPAAAGPGLAPPANPSWFTFDPLFRETPLFDSTRRLPITRVAFDTAPWDTFGSDVAVRQFGVLLASDAPPRSEPTDSRVPFDFGGSGAGLTLHATAGMRLLDTRSLRRGGPHFIVSAAWQVSGGGAATVLGRLSTRRSALAAADAFQIGAAAAGAGRLIVTIEPGRPGPGWAGLTASPAGRFPGAVLAVRAARTGAARLSDALYVYLPAGRLPLRGAITYSVAADGSTWRDADPSFVTLARPAEGQVQPPRPVSPRTTPASDFTALNRTTAGLRVVDPARLAGAAVLFQVELYTGAFQSLAAVATAPQNGPDFPDLAAPSAWPALLAVPAKRAVSGNLPSNGLLSVFIKPVTGTFVPAAELIVTNRRGRALLVYLPEMAQSPAAGFRVFVADDGSTYFADGADQPGVLARGSLGGLPLARAALGQVMPIAGLWPLQQRRPVGLNLCRPERAAILRPGELGIDPEIGQFALAPGDPAIGQGGFGVDYTEAFGDRIGARPDDSPASSGPPATRFVASAGDVDNPAAATFTGAPVHADLASALAAARDGDVIEVADSATYLSATERVLNAPAVTRLTVRAAAGQRPCLAFYDATGKAAAASLHVQSALAQLSLGGLLVSGGPVLLDGAVQNLTVDGCTLDPRSTAPDGALVATAADINLRAAFVVSRSITGGLRVGAGVGTLTVADSIIDVPYGLAVGGPPAAAPAPGPGPATPPADPSAGQVRLERVTVLGRVRCDVLTASECLLDALAVVNDRQAGCLRFSRFELGSQLPRRYQCVPTDAQAAAYTGFGRCLAPRFNSRRFGRPDYAQLASSSPPAIFSAGEQGAEVGAFVGASATLRLANLQVKLREYLPVGMTAVVIAET